MSILDGIRTRIRQIVLFLQTYGQHLPYGFESIFRLTCDIKQLRRSSDDGGEGLTILYVGRGRNFEYIRGAFFEHCEEVTSKRSSLFTYNRHVQRLSATSDVVLVDIGWPYHRSVNRNGEFLELPDWVNMSIELGPQWKQVVQSFRHTTRNNDLRLIRRNEYSYDVTQRRDEIERFHDTMYLPFLRQKQGAGAIKAPRRHIVKRALQGGLLRVTRGDEVVAAGVVYPERNVLYFLWMGLAEHSVDKPAEAAVSALYYFGIRHAFENGFDAVDLTGTRPLLNDGAFRFKRKWGAFVDDCFSPSSILVKPKGGSPRAAEFCRRHPMLARRGGQLESVILTDEAVDPAAIEKLEKTFTCPGVETVSLIELTDESPAINTFESPRGQRFRHATSSLADFAQHYRKKAVSDNSGLSRC